VKRKSPRPSKMRTQAVAGSYAGGHAVVNAAYTPQAATHATADRDAIGNNPTEDKHRGTGKETN
jgi:hypothetical protein